MKINNFLVISMLLLGGSAIFLFIKPDEYIKKPTVTIEEVQKLDKLLTVKLPAYAVVPYEKPTRTLGLTVGKTSFIYVARGYALAGISLSKLTDKDVKITSQGTTITLPKPEVFEVNLKLKNSDPIGYRRDWFAPDSAEVIPEAQKASLQEIAKSVCQDGEILDIANTQAVFMLDFLYQKTKTPVKFVATPVNIQDCVNSVNKALSE